MVLLLNTVGVLMVLGTISAALAESNDLVTYPLTIPQGSEAIVLEVEVGPRAGQAELVLETLDGTLVGTIATFGFKGLLPAGTPQISVRPNPEFHGDVEITGKIVLFGRERPATKDELRGIRLVSQ